MIEITYQTSVSCPFSAKVVSAIVQVAAEEEKKIKGSVEITVVGDKMIRELNRRYRGKDRVTDVLSFAWQEPDRRRGGDGKIKSNLLGELYLCYPQIVRQAKEFNVSSSEEFVRMLVHGLLHSVGYDHVVKPAAARMFKLQEKIVKRVFGELKIK